MFDSSPPQADVYAFGGWASWYLQMKLGLPARLTKPVLSHLFHPVFWSLPAGWLSDNHALMFDPKRCVVPRSAACLFLRGRNDPVLDCPLTLVAILRSAAYADEFASFLGSRSLATVEQATFDKAKHAMAIVDQPAEYKRAHVDQLLSQVACWRLQSGGRLGVR